jgi:C-terminal processing protease CtpA/Prc
VGEVNGMVYLNTEGKLKGLGRMTIQIFDKLVKVVETLSESDGYFSYLGLKPGKFTIKVDDKQLGKLDYQSSPQLHQVEIEVSNMGRL